MNRIMVVDDEAIQRRVLGKMMREALPDGEVMEAGNGMAALELARLHAFDMVITDIRMPIMDGFGFIEHMKEIAPDCKIIILSGYRYFEYAQRAIQLGAFDYLLKPVKEESIAQMLDKVKETILKEKQQNIEQENMKRQLDSNLNVYFEHLLQEWILGNATTGAQLQEIQQQYSLGMYGAVFVTRLVELHAEPLSLERMGEIRDLMPDQYSTHTGFNGRVLSFFPPEDKRIIITIMTDDSPAILLNSLNEYIQNYCRQLSERYNLNVTVGVGEVGSDFYLSAAKSYREALEAAEFRYFLTDDQVFYYRELAGRMKPMHYDFLEAAAVFKDCIRASKTELIIQHTDEVFHRTLEEGLPYPKQWQKSIVYLIYNIATVIKDFLSEEDYRSTLAEIEKRITACATFLDCKKEFLDILQQIMTILQSCRTRKHATIVERCISYIDNHYMEDLSLDSAAQQIFFSPNYLSKILKDHLGVSFTKYLTEIRLKKAIQMLENGDMKVYEIAGKVGFKDDKYFYRVFKARFGITPDDYRKNNALKE
ncbi:two-component system response regulator YesN [Paenibacillus endophyticus]|uniref:Two-component system response regulator YesN n=1 Tax=Paenibacillus endophyticus TaxID=1294268 RepID=A0A7W5CDA2_9BACL|nr:response regulator [Paenibacillus endophyticus]MBB3155585.1 two-component system response regulator YesN [Paenibacillus endophyticus]